MRGRKGDTDMLMGQLGLFKNGHFLDGEWWIAGTLLVEFTSGTIQKSRSNSNYAYTENLSPRVRVPKNEKKTRTPR